jgi:hypothetical protein
MSNTTARRTIAALVLTLALTGCGGTKMATTTNSPPASPTQTEFACTPPDCVAGDAPLPEDAATPAPSPEAATFTTVVDVTDDQGNEGTLRVLSVKRATKALGEFGEKPKFGHYAVFAVSVAVTSGTMAFNSFDFYVQGRDGEKYDYGDGNAITAEDTDKGLDSTDMHAGQKQTRRQVAFDLPAAHGTLVYSPNSDGAALAEWRF